MTGTLPLLPGFNVNFPVDVTKSYFRRQTLRAMGGKDEDGTPNIVVDPPTGRVKETVPTPAESLEMTGHLEREDMPRWAALDAKVLRFFGYFKETVTESHIENHRVRKVVLLYYLKDDSAQVSEPRQENSGMPQGIFVKRHRATRADGQPLTPRDLAVGAEVEIYGRVFYVVDADAFTRDFYAKNNAPLDAALPYPDSPLDVYNATRQKKTRAPPKPSNDSLTRFVEARLGKPSCVLEEDTRRSFLQNNRRVLRFFAVWDDRGRLYGDRRPYIVHMYLEDNTVEVLEINEPNSGRDPFPLLLRRSRLPRGSASRLDVTVRTRRDDCYGPEDMRLGNTIHVHGRPFLLYDCDGFTRAVLAREYGFSEEELRPLEVAEDPAPLAPLVVPEWNGYGSLEDSLQNCLSLVPKPPKADFLKQMTLDKVVLRFVCRLVDNDHAPLSHADADRRFVLSYFLADDTLGVYEPPVRNSGIVGGKFLERSRVYRPQSTEVYRPGDLFVGATLEVHKRIFFVYEADEFTLRFMEQHPDVFPAADGARAVASMREQARGKEDAVREALLGVAGAGAAPGGSGAAAVADALRAAGVSVVEHEVLAALRAMGEGGLPALAEELLGSRSQAAE